MSRGGVAGHPASISFLNRETRVVRLLLGPRFNGAASGSTEASEWSTFIGAGYDFHFGSLTFGPVASLQYTDIGIDDFSERGSLAVNSFGLRGVAPERCGVPSLLSMAGRKDRSRAFAQSGLGT